MFVEPTEQRGNPIQQLASRTAFNRPTSSNENQTTGPADTGSGHAEVRNTKGNGSMYTATVPLQGTTNYDDHPPSSDVADLLSGTTDNGCGLPCRTEDPDLWFSENPAELDQAKAFCADCPLRAQCLAGALDRHEPWGVWGGEIFERGVVIPRKRPRGRPRKTDRQVVAA